MDIFMLLCGRERWILGSTAHYLIMYGHFMFFPAAWWVTCTANRLGRRGLVVGLASLVLCYIIITRFRGPWVWQGMLDYWKQSQLPWLIPSFMGIVAGAATSLYLNNRRKEGAAVPPDDIRYVYALGIVGGLESVASYLWPFDSMFAPSLHVAVGCITILLTLCWFLVVRREVVIT